MSSNLSPFRIEILDANNLPLSGGSIGNVLQLNDTKSLDAIGSLSFQMPAGDRKARYIQSGTKFDVYDQTDGYLGRYLFRSKTITDNNGQGILQVECYDALKELTERTVGFNRNYNFENIDVIIGEILDIVGFSSNVTDTGTSLISLQGESILRAVDELRDRRGVHYRLDFDKTTSVPILDFGPFGDISDVKFEQVKGQIQASAQQNTKLAIITSARIIEESDDIFNRVFPLGFGQGVSQLTIQNATLGTYAIQEYTNADGSISYYIEDTDSINSYGIKERILSLPNIRPLTNSDINVINAANALKLTAETYLQKHLIPRKEYELTVVGLREELLPGQIIDVRYVQSRNGVNYIDIDGQFWVMDVTRNRSSSGNRTFNIRIANVDQRRTTDQDVIVDVVRDLNSINVHIPATLAYSEAGPYTERVLGDANPVSRINADFTLRYGPEVLYLNRCLVRFSTSPLRASAAGAAHNHLMFAQPSAYTGVPALTRGTTVCADTDTGSGGLINVVLDFYSLPSTPLYTFQAGGSDAVEYGLFEDTETPESIGIMLNGTDITFEVNNGSYYAVGGGNITAEIDITDYLLEASGGFRQVHTVTFYALGGRGNIQWQADSLVTIQPIAVSD